MCKHCSLDDPILVLGSADFVHFLAQFVKVKSRCVNNKSFQRLPVCIEEMPITVIDNSVVTTLPDVAIGKPIVYDIVHCLFAHSSNALMASVSFGI